MACGGAHADDGRVAVYVGDGGIFAEVNAASSAVSDAGVAEWYGSGSWCRAERWCGRGWATRRE